MSYERNGLGWSEPSLTDRIFLQATNNNCYGENSRAVCFLDSEVGIAETHNCRARHYWSGGHIGCKTDREQDGKLYCCRPGYPRAYYEPSPAEPGIPSLPPIPGFSPPTGERASFFEKLMHPGALIAMGLFAGAGALIYHNWRHR